MRAKAAAARREAAAAAEEEEERAKAKAKTTGKGGSTAGATARPQRATAGMDGRGANTSVSAAAARRRARTWSRRGRRRRTGTRWTSRKKSRGEVRNEADANDVDLAAEGREPDLEPEARTVRRVRIRARARWSAAMRIAYALGDAGKEILWRAYPSPPEGAGAVRVLCLDGGRSAAGHHRDARARDARAAGAWCVGECFDLIVGTSTGGVIALGVGLLRLTLKEVGELYDEMASEVFKPDGYYEFFRQAGRAMRRGDRRTRHGRHARPRGEPAAVRRRRASEMVHRGGARREERARVSRRGDLRACVWCPRSCRETQPRPFCFDRTADAPPETAPRTWANSPANTGSGLYTRCEPPPPRRGTWRNSPCRRSSDLGGADSPRRDDASAAATSPSEEDTDESDVERGAIPAERASRGTMEPADASRAEATLRCIDGAMACNNPAAVGILRRDSSRGRPLVVVSLGTGAGTPCEMETDSRDVGNIMNNIRNATCDVLQVAATVRHVLGEEDQYFRFQPTDEIFSCDLAESKEETRSELRAAAARYMNTDATVGGGEARRAPQAVTPKKRAEPRVCRDARTRRAGADVTCTKKM